MEMVVVAEDFSEIIFNLCLCPEYLELSMEGGSGSILAEEEIIIITIIIEIIGLNTYPYFYSYYNSHPLL